MKYQHDKELVKKAAVIASVQVCEIRDFIVYQLSGVGNDEDHNTDNMSLDTFPLYRDLLGFMWWNRADCAGSDLVSNYFRSVRAINPDAFPPDQSSASQVYPTPAAPTAISVKEFDPFNL